MNGSPHSYLSAESISFHFHSSSLAGTDNSSPAGGSSINCWCTLYNESLFSVLGSVFVVGGCIKCRTSAQEFPQFFTGCVGLFLTNESEPPHNDLLSCPRSPHTFLGSSLSASHHQLKKKSIEEEEFSPQL